jgi:hypothetical protein
MFITAAAILQLMVDFTFNVIFFSLKISMLVYIGANKKCCINFHHQEEKTKS